VGALALMIILFEGGINLKFGRVVKELPLATGYTVAVFALSCIMMMLLMVLFFGWEPLDALLLGAVIGGTSSAIVISLVEKMNVDECYRIILTLESTITDALSIITAITVVGVISSGSPDLKDLANSFFSAFSIASVIALASGIIWIKVLSRFHKMPFGYLLTIGVLFLLYSIVEYSKGNGAIAAFVFGLILGNSTDIARFLRIDKDFVLDSTIKTFHEEVSFFIRTFFFVYLGLIFSMGSLQESTILVAMAVLLVLIIARLIPTVFLAKKSNGGFGTLMATMMPRGLAAAVLATNPLITSVEGNSFTDIVILIIIFTNIIATVGAFFYERQRQNGSAEDRDYESVLENS
jgi:cell volume regulation protein A